MKRLEDWTKFDNVELSILIVALEDFLEKSPEFEDEARHILTTFRRLLKKQGALKEH